MALQLVIASGGEDADLRDMAAHLLALLSRRADGLHGESGGRKAWDKLQEMLAQFATNIANPMISLDELLGHLEDSKGASFLRLDHPEADDWLHQIMLCLGKETNKEQDPAIAIPLIRDRLLVVADQLNMVPLRDSKPVYMVDAKSNFCEANVAGIIKSSPRLSARNAPYAVVSIVGAQSSGKSYLLNRLLGTEFPEMDATHGWSQTTRGIMMSRCIGPSLLVLDVEGSDGRERGQDTLFEKQAALFALTVSDVMLVNMNVFDIGREHASGSLLFKTIFKERSKLEAGLTKIFVVLRMYGGETPLDKLREDMMKSLEKTWRSVNHKSRKFEDYIQVNVVALPDKKSEDFPEEVTELRRLLSNITVDDNRSAKVPASGFSVSSKMIWDAIKKNKKLDIPSHQEALAELFCRQTANDALKSFYSREDYKLLKAEESPRRFKEISYTLVKSIVTMYDRETEMYDPKVRDNERHPLLEKINKVFVEDSWELIRKTRRSISEQFKSEYVKNLKNMGESAVDLVYDDTIVDSCVTEFMNLCEDLKVFDFDYLHRTSAELQKDLQLYSIHQCSILKEKRLRAEAELARKESQQDVEQLLKRLDEAAKSTQNAEADMLRQTEKQLKEEKEHSRQMLAAQEAHSEKILAEQKKHAAEMLAQQKEHTAEMLAAQKEKDKCNIM